MRLIMIIADEDNKRRQISVKVDGSNKADFARAAERLRARLLIQFSDEPKVREGGGVSNNN